MGFFYEIRDDEVVKTEELQEFGGNVEELRGILREESYRSYHYLRDKIFFWRGQL